MLKCPGPMTLHETITVTGALTADVDYVYGDVMEEYYQDGLPDPGTWIACEVSAIINPAHFYIVLPFGKEPLASLEPAKKEGSASGERNKIPRKVLYLKKKKFQQNIIEKDVHMYESSCEIYT